MDRRSRRCVFIEGSNHTVCYEYFEWNRIWEAQIVEVEADREKEERLNGKRLKRNLEEKKRRKREEV